jgi:hypothetical protein
MNRSRLDDAIDLLGLAAVIVGGIAAGIVSHAYRKVRP